MKARLVIFELHHLGDAILSIPFIRAARNTWDVTVACRPQVADMLQALMPTINVCALPEGWAARAVVVRQKLRLAPVDATACVWPDVRVQSLMMLTGAGTRGGFPMTSANYYCADEVGRKSKLTAGALLSQTLNLLPGPSLLTHACVRASHKQSQLGNWEQLARALGFHSDASLPWIEPPDDVPVVLQSFLKKHSGRRILAVHAGGRLPGKRWPISRFQELLDGYFFEQELPVIIIQAPGETAPQPRGVRQIVIPTPRWEDLAAVLGKIHLLLCNDSFAGHLAAAIGKKVISLFGSADPIWFAPYQNEHHALKADLHINRSAVGETGNFSEICLEAINTKLVEEKLKAVLSSRASIK
jgi:ADP-heptose:LPS heptosyltransferase